MTAANLAGVKYGQMAFLRTLLRLNVIAVSDLDSMLA